MQIGAIDDSNGTCLEISMFFHIPHLIHLYPLNLKILFYERNDTMFFKKKVPGIPVQHYEGLDFPQDFPCRIELTEESLTITRIKPEVTITLPTSQIKSISAMEEENFMLRYHGAAVSTSKTPGIQKYYLVVNYISETNTNKFLAFWGTASEYKKFIDFQYAPLGKS